MNVFRVMATVALAALAVLAALLAADVRAWPAAIERGDALYALDPAGAQWSAQTRLGGLAGKLLGTQGDLAERRGLQLYDQMIVLQRTDIFTDEVETARLYALNALAGADGLQRPVRRLAGAHARGSPHLRRGKPQWRPLAGQRCDRGLLRGARAGLRRHRGEVRPRTATPPRARPPGDLRCRSGEAPVTRGPPRRGRHTAGTRVLMTFLTPLGGLVALAALIPLAAFVAGRRRVAAVRRALGLTPPARASIARHAAVVAAIAALGLAATQPALSSVSTARTRTNVEVLFVLDTSGSMAASATSHSPTRLERAVGRRPSFAPISPPYRAASQRSPTACCRSCSRSPMSVSSTACSRRLWRSRIHRRLTRSGYSEPTIVARGHRQRQLLRASGLAAGGGSAERRGERALQRRPDRRTAAAGLRPSLPGDPLLGWRRGRLRRDRPKGPRIPPQPGRSGHPCAAGSFTRRTLLRSGPTRRGGQLPAPHRRHRANGDDDALRGERAYGRAVCSWRGRPVVGARVGSSALGAAPPKHPAANTARRGGTPSQQRPLRAARRSRLQGRPRERCAIWIDIRPRCLVRLGRCRRHSGDQHPVCDHSAKLRSI